MAQQTIRERFAAWLCAPLAKRVEELGRWVAQTEAEGEEFRRDLAGIASLCQGLADDLNSTLGEIRSQQAEESNKPRVRVARNWTAFSEAATLAAQKGASNGKHIR